MKQHKFYGPQLETERLRNRNKNWNRNWNWNARQLQNEFLVRTKVTRLLGQKSKKGFLCWADREQQ